MTASLRDVAHDYIARGWAVLLLATDGTGGKVPSKNCPRCQWRSPEYVKHSPAECDHLLCHGFYAATTDTDRFDRMLEALPEGQLAIRTGRASRLLVVDAEATAKKPGEPTGIEVLEQWQQFALADWSLPVTLSSRSVSGGLHLYYEIPADVEISSGRVLPNVDVKCEFGYVGAPSGQTARSWVDPAVPVTLAPSELLDWLRHSKRLATGGGGGSGGGSGPGGSDRPDGYDFKKFLADGCPDGYRDYFFNDLCFRLRKNNTPRDSYEEQIWTAWNACEQPKTNYMPWEHVQYKMDRVWGTIDPETDEHSISWAKEIIRRQSEALAHAAPAVGGSGSSGGGEGPPPLQLAIGELDHENWYGTHDDGTAARMLAVWGDWFRAIPKQRAGHVWLRYDGVIWQLDAHERIWQAMTHLVALLPAELSAWEARVRALDADGVVDWRTERVGGNGANANEFKVLVQLRKYRAECRNNARKESGVKAFARLPEVAIAEEDLDANTRYVGLPDGRVLDTRAVHENRGREEWVLTARPDMLLTKKLGCAYVPPDVGVPGTLYEFSEFRRYLEDVLPDKAVRETLQEIIGYALLGEPVEKLILLLHGPPDSGKTVLLEVTEALFGSYGGWTDGQALIAGKAKSAHSEWLHKLRGLRLIVTPETAKGAKIDAAWMKSYTGREPQTSRGAYGDRSVTWKPAGIIVNASNHYIEYDAEDTAVAERTQVIEFEQQFLRGDPRRDDKLPQRIKDGELPIVLNWILEGLRRHGTRRDQPGGARIEIAPKIVEWSRRYRTAQDHIGQFLTDALADGYLAHASCVPGVCDSTCPRAECEPLADSAYVPAKVVYALYKSWCRVQEIKKPIGRNTFNSHLERVYHWRELRSAGKRWDGFTSTITDDITAEITRW